MANTTHALRQQGRPPRAKRILGHAQKQHAEEKEHPDDEVLTMWDLEVVYDALHDGRYFLLVLVLKRSNASANMRPTDKAGKGGCTPSCSSRGQKLFASAAGRASPSPAGPS